MYDLPKKVKEFSCLCCGERFWTIQGSVDLFRDESSVRLALKKELTLEFTSARNN
jgi:hypothetical protein